MAQSSDQLPDFDAKKVYLVAGKTLNKLKAMIQENRTDVVSGGILQVAQRGPEGTFLQASVKTVTLNACVDGVSKSFNFLVTI
jgi:hypothetical protein